MNVIISAIVLVGVFSAASSEKLEQPEERADLFQGDIKLTAKQRAIINTIRVDEAMGYDESGQRKATSNLAKRWPNAEVPYIIDASSSGDTGKIEQAIAHWETLTCVNLVPRTTESDYIKFIRDSGCWSYIGKIGGAQSISIGSGCTYGNTVHEIGHAIGFWHEQSRPDRDSYITVHLENVRSGKEGNFRKLAVGNVVTHNIPYDVGSIMHYGATAFSKNGQNTITAKNPADTSRMGQRSGLSSADVQLANAIYGCNECFTQSNAADYRGEVSTTNSGKSCQKWTSQSPHGHSRTPGNYPNSGLGDHNYCRNPDGEPGAWCYTTDPNSRWEFCDVGQPQASCV